MGKVDDFYEKFKNDPVLIEMINDGSSLSKMAQYMSLPSGTAGHVLSKMGRVKRTVEVVKPVEWDEFTSYLFGLILADGCIHKPRGSRGIGQIDISSSDYEFIKAIASRLKIEHIQVNHKGDKVCYRIYWTDEQWYRMVVDWGLTPRKSFEPILLRCLPVNYNHFIRGFFDGDGSAYTHDRKGYKEINISFHGNKLVLEQLISNLPDSIIVNFSKFTKDKRRNDLYSVSLSSLRGTRLLYDYMYSDCTVFMERKRNIIEEFILSKEKGL